MKKVIPQLLWLTLSVALAVAEDEQDNDCDNPITYASSCTQTSLCEQLMSSGNDSNSPSSLCYRIRSCFLGYCSTSDWVESDDVEGVCNLANEYENGDESSSLCVEDWDSSWWMTDYVEAADCNDESAIYLECNESFGDVSASTTASLAWPAWLDIGCAAIVDDEWLLFPPTTPMARIWKTLSP